VSAATPPALFVPHSDAFRLRRFWNWFPMGLAYALLYMGRYNLTVAKNALGEQLSKDEFGEIFGVGTFVYGLSFIINGPLTDRIGGRKAMLVALLGAGLVNLVLGLHIERALSGDPASLYTGVLVLYALNMYFQSFAAVAIVKVNAAWFHIRERGGFSGIFGTMISSGIFLAFTGNEWILARAGESDAGIARTWWAFLGPAALLLVMFAVELFLLRDQPSQAGQADFDTGEGRVSGDSEEVTGLRLIGRILTHPILLTVALIEFCTGVLRQAVMNWFPIYAKEVWALPSDHALRKGDWGVVGGGTGLLLAFGIGIALFLASRKLSGRARGGLITIGALACLAPFAFGGGWGGLLFVAGVIGGNVAGWCSDLFFHSRRGPTVALFYGMCVVGAIGLYFALSPTPENVGVMAALMFMMSVAVIGSHGLLSGTATMDFGGRKAAGTAVGVIDGFVYLGTGLQAVCLGELTERDWSYWPLFMLPFAVIGFLLCLRIWHAMPNAVRKGGH
jgi:MFS transporter, OPA family, glycerol-3-phosphate transporter